MSGGLIGNISLKNIGIRKPKNAIPAIIKDYSKLITFRNSKNITSEIIFFGSSQLQIYSYYGDFDILSKVFIKGNKEQSKLILMHFLQNTVKNILRNKEIYFVDIKVGTYSDDEYVHWTPKEILAGRRFDDILDTNNHKSEGKTLIDACGDIGHVKIDIVVPYRSRYIELTNFIYIDYNNGHLNYILPETIESIIKALKKEISKNIKNKNYFKVIKRIFATARLLKDTKTLKALTALILSNATKLSTVISDLNELSLLLSLGHKLNVKILDSELDYLKELLSSMPDISFDLNFSLDVIDKAKMYPNSKNSMEIFSGLATYLTDILNENTLEYLNSIGWKKLPKEYQGGDIIKNIGNIFTNKFSPTIENAIKKYGQWFITRGIIYRAPVQKFAKTILNSLTLGQFESNVKNNFDEVFHLYVIFEFIGGITKYFLMEKTPNWVFEERKNLATGEKDYQAMPFHFIHPVKFEDVINGSKSQLGSEFARYNPTTNNCQTAILSLMNACYSLTNMKTPPEIVQFIYQDPNLLFKDISQGVKTIAKSTTDIAHFFNRAIGRGY